jgi:DNA-binding transcriptional regulator YiaG
MQQGLKLQQSSNSAKLLLAEAVHRRTMRCNELIQVKRHHAQLKVKSLRRSLHFSQMQFSEWRQIQISLDSPHKVGSN